MQPEYYITASCLIASNKIIKNGDRVFEHPGNAESLLNEAYTHFQIGYPKFHKMDMLCKLGFLAAEILLKDTDHANRYADTETGLVLCNAHASLDVDLKYVKTLTTGPSPALFVYTLPNVVIGEIAIRHHFKGENAFFVFNHFDGKFIAEYVNTLFGNKLIKNCICGWVDVLKEDYQASLFLVEPENPGNALAFNADHLNQLNLPEHG